MIAINNVDEAAPWAHAVNAACAEVGLLTTISVYIDGDYEWSAWWADGRAPLADLDDQWVAFHRALLLCDVLRPKWLTPSLSLQRLLDGDLTELGGRR